jgi:hypothetical protein
MTADFISRMVTISITPEVLRRDRGNSSQRIKGRCASGRQGRLSHCAAACRLDRLKAAAMEFASIAMLMAGFIMAALFAVDLLDMR